jgi:SNF2 family DNA or RNA helicase
MYKQNEQKKTFKKIDSHIIKKIMNKIKIRKNIENKIRKDCEEKEKVKEKVKKKEPKKEIVKYKIVFDGESDEETHPKKSLKKSLKKSKYEYKYNEKLGINLCKGIEPLKHQLKVDDWMSYRSRCKVTGGIVGLKMGLGKTGSSLFRIAKKCLNLHYYKASEDFLLTKINRDIMKIILKYADREIKPSLVVLPKSALSVWETEIPKFLGDQLKSLVYHRDTLKKKFNTITYKDLCKYHVIIITYETLSAIAKRHGVFETLLEKDGFQRNAGINLPIYTRKIREKLQEMKGGKILFYTLWEDIFADESHRLTNPKSITFYTMMALHAKYKWCLTGSLINNYTSDLYAQLKWLGACEDFANAKQFTYDEYMKRELYRAVLIMSYADAGIILPPIIRKTEILELKGKELEIYQYYQTATREAYSNFIVGGETFASVLTMFLRLRQVCICPYTVLEKSSRGYVETEDIDYNIAQKALDKISNGLVTWLNDVKGTAGMYSAKINKLIDIIKNEIPKGESVVVFTNFKKVMDVIIKRFKKEKISFCLFDGDVKGADRKKSIDDFRSKKSQVFLATIKTGSVSLNLSDIAHNLVTCELWWSPTGEDQGESRIYRYGQTKNVKIWRLMVKDSIDEKMEEICKNKRELAELFMSGKKSKEGKNLNAKLLGQILNVKN